MRMFHLIAGGMLFALLILAGCDDEKKTPDPPAGQPVPIAREFKGQQGPFPYRGFFVVQRPDIWKALWDGQEAPEVNFTNSSVIVALMGQEPTSGYDITITNVRATGQQTVVYAQVKRPAAGEMVTQVISYPYHMVVVSKITQPVIINVAGVTAQPVAILDQLMGQQSNIEAPQTVVVRDQASWIQLWARAFGASASPPQLDFTRFMAVGVFIGHKPTAGYAVTITSAERIDDRLTVNYFTRSPRPDEVVAQTVTSPFAIVILPTNALPIAFHSVTAP